MDANALKFGLPRPLRLSPGFILCILALHGLFSASTALAQDKKSVRKPPSPIIKKGTADNADDLFKTKGAVVPLCYDPPFVRGPVIYLRIEDGKPLPFLLDTGVANALTITEETAKQWGFAKKIESATGQERENGIDIELPHVSIPLENSDKSHVREIELRDLPTVIRSLPGLSDKKTDRTGKQAVVGVVGCDLLFSQATVRLNLSERRLIMMRPDHPELQALDAISLPLIEKGQYFVRLTPPVKPGGKPSPPPAGGYEFGLDTGSEITSLPRRWAAAFGAMALPIRANYSNGSASGQGRQLLYLPSLSLPNHQEYSFVGVTTTDERDFGILGADFLSRFEITVDSGHKKIYFKPLPKSVSQALAFLSLPVFTCNDAHKVEDLIIGSLPERAGLRDGDEIIRVDDVPVQNFPKRALERTLVSLKQSFARLIVRRGAQEVALTYRRYPVASIAAPFDWGCGLEIELQREGNAYRGYVSSVAKGSSADLAGLKESDEMLEIGGLFVATSSWEELTVKLTRSALDFVSVKAIPTKAATLPANPKITIGGGTKKPSQGDEKINPQVFSLRFTPLPLSPP